MPFVDWSAPSIGDRRFPTRPSGQRALAVSGGATGPMNGSAAATRAHGVCGYLAQKSRRMARLVFWRACSAKPPKVTATLNLDSTGRPLTSQAEKRAAMKAARAAPSSASGNWGCSASTRRTMPSSSMNSDRRPCEASCPNHHPPACATRTAQGSYGNVSFVGDRGARERTLASLARAKPSMRSGSTPCHAFRGAECLVDAIGKDGHATGLAAGRCVAGGLFMRRPAARAAGSCRPRTSAALRRNARPGAPCSR